MLTAGRPVEVSVRRQISKEVGETFTMRMDISTKDMDVYASQKSTTAGPRPPPSVDLVPPASKIDKTSFVQNMNLSPLLHVASSCGILDGVNIQPRHASDCGKFEAFDRRDDGFVKLMAQAKASYGRVKSVRAGTHFKEKLQPRELNPKPCTMIQRSKLELSDITIRPPISNVGNNDHGHSHVEKLTSNQIHDMLTPTLKDVATERGAYLPYTDRKPKEPPMKLLSLMEYVQLTKGIAGRASLLCEPNSLGSRDGSPAGDGFRRRSTRFTTDKPAKQRQSVIAPIGGRMDEKNKLFEDLLPSALQKADWLRTPSPPSSPPCSNVSTLIPSVHRDSMGSTVGGRKASRRLSSVSGRKASRRLSKISQNGHPDRKGSSAVYSHKPSLRKPSELGRILNEAGLKGPNTTGQRRRSTKMDMTTRPRAESLDQQLTDCEIKGPKVLIQSMGKRKGKGDSKNNGVPVEGLVASANDFLTMRRDQKAKLNSLIDTLDGQRYETFCHKFDNLNVSTLNVTGLHENTNVTITRMREQAEIHRVQSICSSLEQNACYKKLLVALVRGGIQLTVVDHFVMEYLRVAIEGQCTLDQAFFFKLLDCLEEADFSCIGVQKVIMILHKELKISARDVYDYLHKHNHVMPVELARRKTNSGAAVRNLMRVGSLRGARMRRGSVGAVAPLKGKERTSNLADHLDILKTGSGTASLTRPAALV
jgi:hypothetical protein